MSLIADGDDHPPEYALADAPIAPVGRLNLPATGRPPRFPDVAAHANAVGESAPSHPRSNGTPTRAERSLPSWTPGSSTVNGVRSPVRSTSTWRRTGMSSRTPGTGTRVEVYENPSDP